MNELRDGPLSGPTLSSAGPAVLPSESTSSWTTPGEGGASSAALLESERPSPPVAAARPVLPAGAHDTPLE